MSQGSQPAALAPSFTQNPTSASRLDLSAKHPGARNKTDAPHPRNGGSLLPRQYPTISTVSRQTRISHPPVDRSPYLGPPFMRLDPRPLASTGGRTLPA